MIISRSEFLLRAQLDPETLEAWVEEEWLIPIVIDTEPGFSEADLARAQLIWELKRDLGVNDEGIGVILNLLDQVHGLRTALVEVLQAMRGHRSAPAVDWPVREDKGGG